MHCLARACFRPRRGNLAAEVCWSKPTWEIIKYVTELSVNLMQLKIGGLQLEGWRYWILHFHRNYVRIYESIAKKMDLAVDADFTVGGKDN